MRRELGDLRILLYFMALLIELCGKTISPLLLLLQAQKEEVRAQPTSCVKASEKGRRALSPACISQGHGTSNVKLTLSFRLPKPSKTANISETHSAH